MPTETTKEKQPTQRSKRQTFVVPKREEEMFAAILKARYPYETHVESMVFRELVREEYARMQHARERSSSKGSAHNETSTNP